MKVLLIGAGGLGCAVLTAIAGAPWDVTVIDPDRVERSNLARQVLYDDRSIGRSKAELAAARSGGRARIDRFAPENAIALARDHDLVIEGTDRHETKFLVADACVLADRPVVHAGVVGWSGWAMACRPRESACLRCVFEEVPAGAAVATCAENGVVGSAVGVVGALQASLALGVTEGRAEAAGTVLRYDARAGSGRASRVKRRAGCALCGAGSSIRRLDPERYRPACPA